MLTDPQSSSSSVSLLYINLYENSFIIITFNVDKKQRKAVFLVSGGEQSGGEKCSACHGLVNIICIKQHCHVYHLHYRT